MSILTFLADQAGKVLAWFGDKFWTLYNGALNAWAWAVDRASKAFTDAVNWAWYQIQNISEDLSGVIDWVQDELGQLQGNVYEWARDALGSFQAWAVSWINYLSGQVAAIGAEVGNVYNQVVAGVSGWIAAQVEVARRWVSDTFGWILSIRTQVVGLVAALTPDKLAAILDLVNRRAAQIATFFDDPLQFILDVIQPKVLTFLSYVIAYALGSTKYTLPNMPKWRDK